MALASDDDILVLHTHRHIVQLLTKKYKYVLLDDPPTTPASSAVATSSVTSTATATAVDTGVASTGGKRKKKKKGQATVSETGGALSQETGRGATAGGSRGGAAPPPKELVPHSSLELAYYLLQVQPIIAEYEKILAKEGQGRSFTTSHTKKVSDSRLKTLKNSYVCIAQQYVNVENFIQKIEDLKCSQCGNQTYTIDTNGTYECEKCQAVITIVDSSPAYRDSDTHNMSSKYKYTQRNHFRDAIKKFQGLQNTDPRKINRVVDRLTAEMRSDSVNPKTVSCETVYKYLTDLKENDHYVDVYLIHNILTRVECPNITAHLTDLMYFFELQEDVLMNMDLERSNSINVYYKLFKLLQKVGYECTINDFYILKTDDIRDTYDSILQMAWNKLGWPWIKS